MNKLFKQKWGYGVFTTSDIASILRIPTQRVARYLREYGDRRWAQRLFGETYTWEVDGARIVNFYALIEFAMFFLLRDHYGLSIRRINEARESIGKAFGTPYPLATSDVFTDSKKIFYEYLGELANADKTHQLTIKEFIAPLLEKIEFQDGFAAKYFPLGRDHEVVIDPKHQFGQPTIKDTNIRVDVIGSMHHSGESIENLCSLFDISQKQVSDALTYYRKAA